MWHRLLNEMVHPTCGMLPTSNPVSWVASSQTSSRARSSYTTGPVKKYGTPDMRYAANRSSYGSPSGPLKSDGTPDMRYVANRSSYGSPYSSGYPSGGASYIACSSSDGGAYGSSSCGPLKKDGTPDMRYAANRSSYGSPYSSGYQSGGASYSASSSSDGGAYGSSSCSPLKSDGTPDMRYAANRSSYDSPYSSGYPSGGASYSASSFYSGLAFGSSSCGPLKSDGTPDMRYAVNRSSYDSPYSSGYPSGGASYIASSSSDGGAYGSSSCGPLKGVMALQI
ncbi:hypothetical protein OS493_018427 [Desmophyllum pertusum]|uniref:Uncharacterized protein n=1 Tax=Desmophyllum pertusum TaxID=174260 RepID=A0A9X0A223_9CNID|nr:hypothetical protein OS493_018427 [Desmophyllum pertusum]